MIDKDSHDPLFEHRKWLERADADARIKLKLDLKCLIENHLALVVNYWHRLMIAEKK